MPVRPSMCALLALFWATIGASGSAWAQPDRGGAKEPGAAPEDPAYAQHMTNGVRLFKSDDFRAALKEFEAAYDKSPRASPLINQALCYRKLGKYPRAVERLELALAEHAGSMSADDAAAAKKAIEEMRAVFAYATVTVKPEDAKLTIDGEEVPPEARAGRIPLSPGDHEIVASAPGHRSRSEKISVASGDEKSLTLDLEADSGTLVVIAARKTTPIEVDGTVVGQGTWRGPVSAGVHEVRAIGESGIGRVEVKAGASITLDLTAGEASPLPPLPGPPDKPAAASEPAPTKRGFYGSVNGAVLFPARNPRYFSEIEGLEGLSSGAFVGLRPGYRVHTYAGFEAIFEYGNVTGPGDATEEPSFSLSLVRLGPVVRLMSPGDTIRFLGTLGGGLSIGFMSYDGLSAAVCPELDSDDCASVGADFFAMSEVGFEVDIDRVLLGLSVAVYLNGTKGINDFEGDQLGTAEQAIGEPYGNDVLPMFGPRIHIGYGFW